MGWACPGDWADGSDSWEGIVDQDVRGRLGVADAERISFLRKGASALTYPVAVLNEATQQQLGAKSRVVKLSGETLAKQLVKRGDSLPLEEYWKIQGVLETPDAVVADGENHMLFFKRDGRVYLAVVKTTRDKGEVYLQSFRRATERELQKALARGP